MLLNKCPKLDYILYNKNFTVTQTMSQMIWRFTFETIAQQFKQLWQPLSDSMGMTIRYSLPYLQHIVICTALGTLTSSDKRTMENLTRKRLVEETRIKCKDNHENNTSSVTLMVKYLNESRNVMVTKIKRSDKIQTFNIWTSILTLSAAIS